MRPTTPFHQQHLMRQFQDNLMNLLEDNLMNLLEDNNMADFILEEEVVAAYSSYAEDLKNNKAPRLYIQPITQLLLLYKPQYNSLIVSFIEHGSKIRSDDFVYLFSVVGKISDEVLTKILKTHEEEMDSPVIYENFINENIFALAAKQMDINFPLLNHLIKEKKLDPTIQYLHPETEEKLSGVEIAVLYENFSLLAFYQAHYQSSMPKLPEKLLIELNEHKKFSLNTNENPNEEKFVTAVKEFKQRHGIKSLRQWFAHSKIEQLTLLQALFLTKKEIATFLLRETVTLNKNIPCYPKYERSIYTGLETRGRLLIPFRTDRSTLSKEEADACGRLAGNVPSTSKFITKILLEKLPLTKHIKILIIEDIYDLERRLLFIEKIDFEKNKRFVYFINPVGKDNHAFIILSVLDTQEKKIKLHILFNSWKNVKYLNYLEKRINNEHYCNDLVPTPVFDASIHVQTEKNDSFCGSYAIEISRAVYLSLFKEKNLENALNNFVQKPEKSEQDWEPLKQQFHVAMKKRLPMFYQIENQEIKEKSSEEIINWHIQNRFRYGRFFLMEKIDAAQKRIQQDKQIMNSCENRQH